MANLQSRRFLAQLGGIDPNSETAVNVSPFRWIVASEAEKNALTVTEADRYKICFIKSTCQQFVLTSAGPVIWQELNRGLSAYDIAVNHGFIGNEAEWLQSLSCTAPSGEVETFLGLQLVKSIQRSGNIAEEKISISVDPSKASRFVIRGRQTPISSTGYRVLLQINDDRTAANYHYYMLYNKDGAAASSVVSNYDGMVIQHGSGEANISSYSEMTLNIQPGRHPIAHGFRVHEMTNINNVMQTTQYKKTDPVTKFSIILPASAGQLSLDIYEEKILACLKADAELSSYLDSQVSSLER